MLCPADVSNSIGQHEDGKYDEVDACQCLRQALIVAHQPAKAASPRKASLDDLALRQKHEVMLGRFDLHDLQINARFSCDLPWCGTRITLIDISDLYLLATDGLHLIRQLLDLCPLLLVGRRDVHSHQISQRIEGHVYLGAALAFMAVIPGAGTAFNRRLQRAPVQHASARLTRPSLRGTQDRA